MMYTVRLKRNRDEIFRKHNPWVFTGAIDSVSPAFFQADNARVISSSGTFIAYGWYDEKAHTTLHLLSWDEGTVPGECWLREKVRQAVDARASVLDEDTTCCRLIHGEADFIPGLAADIYGDTIRIIISSRYAADHVKETVRALFEYTEARRIDIFTDNTFARLENLRNVTRHFTRDGEVSQPSQENILFRESGIWYEIESGISQKSGFYCDQRENRNIVEAYTEGKRVLDVCCFTGSFTLHALRSGAREVHCIDASESVLRHLLYQIHLNENKGVLPPGSRQKVTTRKADAFEALRQEEENSWDVIILDPPKLASSKSRLQAALKGYKDLSLAAMRLVRDGGIIASFSCSGAVSKDDFRRATAWAAADLGYEIQILNQLTQASDHPVRISLEETEYLKGLVYRVIK